MALIRFTTGKADDVISRRPVDLLMPGEGASPRGSSYYKRAMGCAFEHALANEYKIKPERENEAFAIGKIVHKAFELYYKALLEFQKALDAKRALRNDYYYFGGILAAQQAAWDAISVFATEPGYTKTWEIVERIVSAYFEKYTGMDRWRILAVEETLQYTVDGFDYSARLDLVVEHNELTWIVEHKTARSISPDSLDNYDMDPQTLGQQWLFKNVVDPSAFPPLGGVIVNIATKTKIAQFHRKDVCSSQAHLDMFVQAIQNQIALIAEMERLGWPRSIGHCAGAHRGYSRCQYFDGCRGFPLITAEEFASNPPGGFIVANEDEDTDGDSE